MNTTASRLRFSFAAPVLSTAFALVACSSAPEVGPIETEVLGEVSDAIVGGVRATEFPEAALVDMSRGGRGVSICSGSLIAPRVVLTAGHCIGGFDGWTVRLPYAGGQVATAEGAAVLDYVNDSDFVNPNQHDVGLVFLSRALTLPVFPVLAQAGLADGAKVFNIGRIKDGVASRTDLYFGSDVTVRAGSRFGFPFSYVTDELIQSGDSGGPVEVSGSSPHRIVAVNSGGGGGTQILARVDLVSTWIDQQVRAHGGFASTPAPAPTPTPSPTPTPTPTPAPACAAREAEPNDSYRAANVASARELCGSLASSTDQDWFSFNVARANAAYRVGTAASGVELRLWKETSTGFRQVTNRTATEVSGVASTAGKYLGVVFSPGGTRVNYKLELER